MVSYAIFKCETCGCIVEASGPHEYMITTKNEEKHIENFAHSWLGIKHTILVSELIMAKLLYLKQYYQIGVLGGN